jgi:hypothetical protein
LFIAGDEASNPVPVIVTGVPVVATVGEKPVIVGGAEVSGAKVWVLRAQPEGEETEMLPVPPAGTVTVSWVTVAAVTVATTPPVQLAEPPKRTVFWEGVAEYPEP